MTAVVSFNAKGKKVSSLNLYEEYGLPPFGVVVDSDNMVNILSDGNLVKLTPDLKMVKKSKKVTAMFWNVSIIGDELLVCDESKGVQVFTKELEFVRKVDLHSEVLKRIYDISSDGHGSLYVCSLTSPGVHVFMNDGQFLRSFGRDKSTRPHSLHVMGNYVYVTDQFSHDVVVYTTAGVYITSLKQQANYRFNTPRDICADKDGFIYICDTDNNKIVVM